MRTCKLIRGILAVLLVAFTSAPTANAQHQVGRWMLGVHADGNMWFNDLNQRIVGLGADLIGRYGFSREVSVSVEFGMERLKTGQEPSSASKPFDYIRTNAFHFSLLGYLHLLPGKAAAPYAFVGIGLFPYTAYAPIKNIEWTQTSVRIPFGVGIETFVHKGIAYDFNAGYVILNDETDVFVRKLPDGYVNVRFGVNFYLGSSDDEDVDGDGLTNAQERALGTNPTNADTDEDGLGDKEESAFGTDPLNPDTDRDKLKDGEEVMKYFTNPLNPDTDGDGYPDGEEVFRGSDPKDPKSIPKPKSE